MTFKQLPNTDESSHHTDESSAATQEKARLLSAWLHLSDCYECVPCMVLLGNKSFVGCSYKQDRPPLPGAPNQEPYTMEAIYCLGEAPKAHKTVFRHGAGATGEGDRAVDSKFVRAHAILLAFE